MIKNKFIVVEGIEGAGKTTAIKFIKKTLSEIGINNILSVREPGGTVIAEKIRNLVKTTFSDECLTVNSELLLMYAARIQLIETVVKPSLKKGMWVIGDRHYLSSYAYQGSISDSIKKNVLILQNVLFKNFKPDLTFFLDVEPSMGLVRIKKRKLLDRIEKKTIRFFIKVRLEYLKMIKKTCNIICINANLKKSSVHKEIKENLYRWLKVI